MRCSICHAKVQESDSKRTCPGCEQEYHDACWVGIGGCATYGCTKAAPAKKPVVAPVMGGGWGDQKACPACSASIPSSMLVCRCGATFPWADPMTSEEHAAWTAGQTKLASLRSELTVLFIVTTLGIVAPLTGVIAGVKAHKNREELQGANGAFLALGYGSFALGIAYSLVFAALALG